VKVHDKECFGGGDFLATFVFLAFDAAVASGEFGAEGVGDVVDVPVCVEKCERERVFGCGVFFWCVRSCRKIVREE